ncbi:S8 family peptidase [Brevundimonas sp. SORGH_AS_0993]|uniref:S8 family peptidase n=1 Tax=Brevundimonas sp. SORGH_AS_0993 TaxID=3041794 RepID=UPI00278A7F61|nr:S8 family peptidase [Brevundimonas sp. SORGH_AS_0993]MDQ1153446.1 hypothetical protein [Brevundimonas sp. SORGH_AS_0993]
MPSAYNRRHIRVESFATAEAYRRPNLAVVPRDYARIAAAHAEALSRDFASAIEAASARLLGERDATVGEPGAYVGVETAPNGPAPDLEWKTQGVRVSALDRTESGSVRGTLFVPDAAREFVTARLNEYGQERTAAGKPRHDGRFAPIERFFEARLENLWTDSRALPEPHTSTWWELWCWQDRVQNAVTKAQALGLPVAGDQLVFPERVLIYVHGTRDAISRLVASCDAVAELRMGRDTAAYFMGLKRPDQHGWVDEAVERLERAADASGTALCVLDTGVNIAHAMIAPVLPPDRRFTVKREWGFDDHDGHGSEMAGLAAFGDLSPVFQTHAPIPIDYTLESVKLVHPPTLPATDPGNFGLITAQAIAIPEIAFPQTRRIYCLAVTQIGVHGPRATSWSAALDAAAFECAEPGPQAPDRLIMVSAGNLQDDVTLTDLEQWEDFEIEDPAQAWNVLTIGGVTDKVEVVDKGYEAWKVAAEAGALSPYSRISSAWNRGVAPIKPELVVEAGNRGIDPADESMLSGMPSLSLLTTSASPVTDPLSVSWATSAATAVGSGMAAGLWSKHGDLWPETIRALLVHSARWSPWMETRLLQTNSKSERLRWLRHFGYGVPSLDRAAASASNSLALVAQREIQPFKKPKGATHATSKEADFYTLPWPRDALLELGAHQVRVRATLSYFVEPNPNAAGSILAARYRSAGLRFGFQLRNETSMQFAARINQLASLDEEAGVDVPEVDAARVLGERSISAGSLHVDEWRGAAADFADRNGLAVFPVGGWWKGVKDRVNRSMRYALVVTIDAGDTEIDLHAEVAAAVAVQVDA